jgi:hypothetical protein
LGKLEGPAANDCDQIGPTLRRLAERFVQKHDRLLSMTGSTGIIFASFRNAEK